RALDLRALRGWHVLQRRRARVRPGRSVPSERSRLVRAAGAAEVAEEGHPDQRRDDRRTRHHVRRRPHDRRPLHSGDEALGKARWRTLMAASPYAINLDTKFAPLEFIDIPQLVAAVKDGWFNQTLCRVNDCVVRLGVMQGEFHWHKHDHEDEFFYVIEGRWV